MVTSMSAPSTAEPRPAVLTTPRLVFYFAALMATEAYLWLFKIYDWWAGITRGFLLAGLLVWLLALRLIPEAPDAADSPWRRRRPALAVSLLLAVAVLFQIITAVDTVRLSIRDAKIPLDQGQNSWRAARLLWRGENPYGLGAVVDFHTYHDRTALRRAAGVASTVPAAEINALLAQYDRTLDPALREQLLPSAKGPVSLKSELGRTGYKYGPLLFLLTALAVPLGLPASVVMLNALASAGLFWVMYRLMGGPSDRPTIAALGLSALLLDTNVRTNYIQLTATDVWALWLCALAVLASRADRPAGAAVALALAIGCKVFPSLIFVPLLLRPGGLRPLAIFAAVVVLIYLPWFAWDRIGTLDTLPWPFYMQKGPSSWLYFAWPQATMIVRLMVLGAMAILWLRYLAGRETRLFWTLAMINALLLTAGGALHNNYVPWVSIWIVAAIGECLWGPPAPAPVLVRLRTACLA